MSAARTPLSGAGEPGTVGLDQGSALSQTQDENLAVQGTPEDEEEMEADLVEQEELEDATAGLDSTELDEEDDLDAEATEDGSMDDADDDVIPLPDQSQPGGYR